MNIENIKSQFPIFSKKINGKPLVYLDSSNSSQKPMCVINRLNDFYKNEFSNIGRSIHSLAINATNKFEDTRISVKNFINANSREEIIFTKNGTEAINLVATTFGQQNIEKGEEIIITELEHHSNEIFSKIFCSYFFVFYLYTCFSRTKNSIFRYEICFK